MSLSDCPKCWDTPCVCGHEYKYLSDDDLRHLIKTLQLILKERVIKKINKNNKDL